MLNNRSIKPLLLVCLCWMAGLWAVQGEVMESTATSSAGEALADPVADPLTGFSPAARELLGAAISSPVFEGVISAGRVSELLDLQASAGGGVPQLMVRLLPLASSYALPPVSDFHVGAVAEGASGALYLGANLEIAGSALGFTVHAEQSAMNNALLHGEPGIKRIAVTAAPCGHCRQFMNELDRADQLTVIVQGQPPIRLDRLLPYSFSPLDLGLERGLPAMQTPARQCPVRPNDALACRGVAAIRHSYAPHSASPSALALRTDKVIAVGAYIENAAYNPSLPPLQSALDRLRFKQTGIGGIREVVLVEVAGVRISQASYARAALADLAPAARFTVVTVE